MKGLRGECCSSVTCESFLGEEGEVVVGRKRSKFFEQVFVMSCYVAVKKTRAESSMR